MYGASASNGATITPTLVYPVGSGLTLIYSHSLSSYGHVVADFDVPEARELVRRGMHWAAGSGDGCRVTHPSPSFT